MVLKRHVFQKKIEDTDHPDLDQVQCSQGMHSADQHAKHQPEFLKACLTISKKKFSIINSQFPAFLHIFLLQLND